MGRGWPWGRLCMPRSLVMRFMTSLGFRGRYWGMWFMGQVCHHHHRVSFQGYPRGYLPQVCVAALQTGGERGTSGWAKLPPSVLGTDGLRSTPPLCLYFPQPPLRVIPSVRPKQSSAVSSAGTDIAALKERCRMLT